nr:immunoglobulin heavy chain junction region [Macaca mulatta]MOV45654.1 immunoglobulin heavy chain junction region [Macaca mulatta]
CSRARIEAAGTLDHW